MGNFKNWIENEKDMVGAVALLSQDKMLVLKRGSRSPWMPGKWNLPGGVVRAAETPQQAALRECIEETGIQPESLRMLTVVEDSDYTLHAFVGHTHTMRVHLDYENSEFAWITKEMVPAYDFVPHVRNILLQAIGG